MVGLDKEYMKVQFLISQYNKDSKDIYNKSLISKRPVDKINYELVGLIEGYKKIASEILDHLKNKTKKHKSNSSMKIDSIEYKNTTNTTKTSKNSNITTIFTNQNFQHQYISTIATNTNEHCPNLSKFNKYVNINTEKSSGAKKTSETQEEEVFTITPYIRNINKKPLAKRNLLKYSNEETQIEIQPSLNTTKTRNIQLEYLNRSFNIPKESKLHTEESKYMRTFESLNYNKPIKPITSSIQNLVCSLNKRIVKYISGSLK